MVASFLARRDGRWCYAEDLSRRLAAAGLTVRTASSYSFRPLRLADMVGAALGCRGGFDVGLVDVYSGQAFLWAEAAGRTLRARGKPWVAALHGGALPEHARREPERVKAFLRLADAAVAPSAYLLEAFAPWRPDIRLIPNAIDLAACRPRRRVALRPRLIWLRSFHRMYNPQMAVRVLARILPYAPEAELTMAGIDRGDGSLQECRRLARDLGVEARVRFPGCVPKSEVGHLLDQADVFLNTTDVDNTPVSVLEAMACGLCVASTDAGGLPQLLRDGEDALLVRVGDAEAMAARVLRLLREPELAQRLSGTAAERAAGFGWERVLPEWVDLFSGLAARRMERTA